MPPTPRHAPSPSPSPPPPPPCPLPHCPYPIRPRFSHSLPPDEMREEGVSALQEKVLSLLASYTGQEEEAVRVSDPHTLAALAIALIINAPSLTTSPASVFPGPMSRTRLRRSLAELYRQVSSALPGSTRLHPFHTLI